MSKQVTSLTPEKQMLLERRLKAALGAAVPKRVIARRTAEGAAPLSFSQRQMWLIDQMTPGSSAYNIPAGYRFKGELNTGALEAAFNEVIKRHENLRTTFASADPEPVQRVHPAWRLKLHVVELDHLPAGHRESAFQKLAAAESARPFDLETLPLMRASLIRLAEVEHVLFVNMHHIISDGLSMTLLLNELCSCYQAVCAGTQLSLPDLPIQYADFAVWQRGSLRDHVLEKQLSFWKQHLGGNLAVLELPTDYARPTVQTYRGAQEVVVLPKTVADSLQNLSQQEGATLLRTS
jgi:hypothetical protein